MLKQVFDLMHEELKFYESAAGILLIDLWEVN
jgi:hypothetical protein